MEINRKIDESPKHSGLGIASFVLGAFMLALFLASIILVVLPGLLEILLGLMVVLVGTGLAIAGVVQKNVRKTFSILGLVFNMALLF